MPVAVRVVMVGVMLAMPMFHRLPVRDDKKRDRQQAKDDVEPESVVQREVHHLRMHVRPGRRKPAQCVERHIHNEGRHHHHRRVEHGGDVSRHLPAAVTPVYVQQRQHDQVGVEEGQHAAEADARAPYPTSTL